MRASILNNNLGPEATSEIKNRFYQEENQEQDDQPVYEDVMEDGVEFPSQGF